MVSRMKLFSSLFLLLLFYPTNHTPHLPTPPTMPLSLLLPLQNQKLPVSLSLHLPPTSSTVIDPSPPLHASLPPLSSLHCPTNPPPHHLPLHPSLHVYLHCGAVADKQQGGSSGVVIAVVVCVLLLLLLVALIYFLNKKSKLPCSKKGKKEVASGEVNNDIVVEMKTDKANEEAGLLHKRPSTEQ